MKRVMMAFMIVITGLVGLPITAANIANADYRAQISFNNTGYASANNAVPFLLNAQSMIDQNYINPDYSNVALVDGAGNDVPFMPPAPGSNTWMAWLPDIGQGSNVNNYLYVGGPAMNGKIRYFPGNAGMYSNDSATLEPGSSAFSMSLKGYFDSSKVGQYVMHKDGAMDWVYSASGVITCHWYTQGVVALNSGYDTGNNYSRLVSLDDNGAIFGRPFDVNGTMAISQIAINAKAVAGIGKAAVATLVFTRCEWADNYWYTLYTPIGSPLYSTQIWAENDTRAIGDAWIYVDINPPLVLSNDYYAWYLRASISSSPSLENKGYFDIPIYTNTQIPTAVTSTGRSFSNRYEWTSEDDGIISAIEYGSNYPHFRFMSSNGGDYSVSAPLPAGEHTVQLSRSGNTVSLSVDGTVANTTAFSGTIINNAAPWVWLENGTVPYMESLAVQIGTARQAITWQPNVTTFTDTSGQNNHAYPSFRTTSTNPNVSASVSNLAPLTTTPPPETTPTIPTTIPPTATPPWGTTNPTGGPITSVPADQNASGIGPWNITRIPYVGKPIASFFDKHNWPYGLFVYPLMMFFIVLAAFGCYWISKDLGWMGAGQFLMSGLFIALGLLPIPSLFLFGVVLVFCIVKRRAPQV